MFRQTWMHTRCLESVAIYVVFKMGEKEKKQDIQYIRKYPEESW